MTPLWLTPPFVSRGSAWTETEDPTSRHGVWLQLYVLSAGRITTATTATACHAKLNASHTRCCFLPRDSRLGKDVPGDATETRLKKRRLRSLNDQAKSAAVDTTELGKALLRSCDASMNEVQRSSGQPKPAPVIATNSTAVAVVVFGRRIDRPSPIGPPASGRFLQRRLRGSYDR